MCRLRPRTAGQMDHAFFLQPENEFQGACGHVYLSNLSIFSLSLAQPPSQSAPSSLSMAPHLSAADRDFLVRMTVAKKSPVEIHTHLVARKMRQRLPAPALNNLRKALKGLTYKQGRKETRGRKRIVECKKGMMDTRVRIWRTHTNPSLHFVRQRRKLSVTNAKAMNKVRKRLKKATWSATLNT